MSTPSFLALPPGARRVQLSTARGPVTGLRHDAIGPRQGSVLLVPGWTGSKEDFLAVLEPLARLGWDVVTYDQRGQYETTGPDEESAYTLTALGTDLLDLVASLQPVHVVGHSFGGLVSREAALMSGGDGFASLTLLCSGPASIPGEQQAALEAMYQALTQVPMEAIWEAKSVADREWGWEPTPEQEDFMRRKFLANNPYGLRAKTGVLISTPDRSPDLAVLVREGLPVSVVYGEHDDGWPVPVQDEMAAVLGVTPITVLGCAHSPAVDDPEQTATLLDAAFRTAGGSPGLQV